MVVESLFGIQLSFASVLLRVMMGIAFMIHGYPKLKSGGKDTGEWLKGMGIPYGFGLFAGVVEFFGGIALLLGVLTSIVAALFVLWMLALTWLSIAKLKKKFSGGWEIDLLYLVLSITIATVGSGIFSLDRLLGI